MKMISDWFVPEQTLSSPAVTVPSAGFFLYKNNFRERFSKRSNVFATFTSEVPEQVGNNQQNSQEAAKRKRNEAAKPAHYKECIQDTPTTTIRRCPIINIATPKCLTKCGRDDNTQKGQKRDNSQKGVNKCPVFPGEVM